MKNHIWLLVVVIVMAVTLVGATGAWAAPAEKDTRPPIIPVLGPGQYVINASTLPAWPGGRIQNFAAVMVTIPGKVCFVDTFESVQEFGHIRAAAIRKLDNGKWVSNVVPARRTELSTSNGHIICGEVGVGIWAFQGW